MRTPDRIIYWHDSVISEWHAQALKGDFVLVDSDDSLFLIKVVEYENAVDLEAALRKAYPNCCIEKVGVKWGC